MNNSFFKPVRKVSSRYSGCGIRSASFQGDVLTVGTGLGILMFYDLKAGKYLDSSINSSRTVVLKTGKGYVVMKLSFYFFKFGIHCQILVSRRGIRG